MPPTRPAITATRSTRGRLLIAAVALLAQAAVGSLTTIDNGLTLEFVENFESFAAGVAPSDAGYSITQTTCTGNTDNVVAETITGSQRGWAIVDATPACAYQLTQSAPNVDMCRSGAVFNYNFEQPTSFASGTQIMEINLGAGSAATGTMLPNHIGLQIIGGFGNDGITLFVRGSTLAAATSNLGASILPAATNVHVKIDQVVCSGAPASARFTLTGGVVSTQTVTAASNFISTPLNNWRVATVGTVATATGIIVDDYDFSGVSKPSPTISSVSPNSGLAAGGTSVTITGTNYFANGPTKPTVTFDGVMASGIVVNSATSLSGFTPAHATGIVNVVVTNPDGQSITLVNGYTYNNEPPIISSFNPTSGSVSGGTIVTITGSNFVTGATVTFDTSLVSATFINSGKLIAVSPRHSPGTVSIKVINPDTQSNTLSGYTYILGNGDPNINITASQATGSGYQTAVYYNSNLGLITIAHVINATHSLLVTISTDGGNTWTDKAVGILGTNAFPNIQPSIVATDANHIAVMIADPNAWYIYHTTNGGTSWQFTIVQAGGGCVVRFYHNNIAISGTSRIIWGALSVTTCSTGGVYSTHIVYTDDFFATTQDGGVVATAFQQMPSNCGLFISGIDLHTWSAYSCETGVLSYTRLTADGTTTLSAVSPINDPICPITGSIGTDITVSQQDDRNFAFIAAGTGSTCYTGGSGNVFVGIRNADSATGFRFTQITVGSTPGVPDGRGTTNWPARLSVVNTGLVIGVTYTSPNGTAPFWYVNQTGGVLQYNKFMHGDPQNQIQSVSVSGDCHSVVLAYRDFATNKLRFMKFPGGGICKIPADATITVSGLVGMDVDQFGTSVIARINNGGLVQTYDPTNLGTLGGPGFSTTTCTSSIDGVASYSMSPTQALVSFFDCDNTGKPYRLQIRSTTLDTPALNTSCSDYCVINFNGDTGLNQQVLSANSCSGGQNGATYGTDIVPNNMQGMTGLAIVPWNYNNLQQPANDPNHATVGWAFTDVGGNAGGRSIAGVWAYTANDKNPDCVNQVDQDIGAFGQASGLCSYHDVLTAHEAVIASAHDSSTKAFEYSIAVNGPRAFDNSLFTQGFWPTIYITGGGASSTIGSQVNAIDCTQTRYGILANQTNAFPNDMRYVPDTGKDGVQKAVNIAGKIYYLYIFYAGNDAIFEDSTSHVHKVKTITDPSHPALWTDAWTPKSSIFDNFNNVALTGDGHWGTYQIDPLTIGIINMTDGSIVGYVQPPFDTIRKMQMDDNGQHLWIASGTTISVYTIYQLTTKHPVSPCKIQYTLNNTVVAESCINAAGVQSPDGSGTLNLDSIRNPGGTPNPASTTTVSGSVTDCGIYQIPGLNPTISMVLLTITSITLVVVMLYLVTREKGTSSGLVFTGIGTSYFGSIFLWCAPIWPMIVAAVIAIAFIFVARGRSTSTGT